ncbi:MAG: hypothetical protein R3F24_12725 [Gammaproteobacteria bacterium]
MGAAYEKLGMIDLANDARTVLVASFPERAKRDVKQAEEPGHKFW